MMMTLLMIMMICLVMIMMRLKPSPRPIGGNTAITNTGLHNAEQGAQVWEGGYNCKSNSHQSFVFFILSCGDEQNIFLLERASSMPDSSKPRSIKSITWKWKCYQLKLKWEEREQQLLFFYPDNEVTIITLVFFFIFSLQLCHSFYNFFTILQFRKQFHYSNKTALNIIGTTPFPFHVHRFFRLQPTCTMHMFTLTMFSTCARSPVLALALGQLTMWLCNSTCTWPPAQGPALALALPLATCATLALPLALVHQNIAQSLENSPLAQLPRTHHRQYLSPQGKPLRPEVGFL